MQEINCHIVESPTEDSQWDAFVLRSPLSSIYHLSKWKHLIYQCFKHDSYYIKAVDGAGDCTGVLPLVHLSSVLFGNFFVSLPFFNYGGVCADDQCTEEALWAKAQEIATEKRAQFIELRCTRTFPFNVPVKTSKVTMKLDLPSTGDELWKSFTSKLRSQIKRPIKEGMTAEIGGHDLLHLFYRVFAENMRSLGTPVYPKRFFEAILNAFPDSAHIAAVRDRDGNPVAAGFMLGYRDQLEIPWASSLKSHNHLGPNMLLYSSVLKFACERGFRVFDFGRSTPGEGTFRFKQQWGALPEQLYWYYWIREGEAMPNLNPTNSKYAAAITIWKKLPLAVTNRLGPLIVRNIP